MSEQNYQTQESTIFDESDIIIEANKKNMRNARSYLYVIGAIQICVGFYTMYQLQNLGFAMDYMLLGFTIDASIGLALIGCAIWSYWKPYWAFITALVCMAVFVAIASYIDISNLYKGIILKVLAVVALLKAMKDAKEEIRLKEQYGKR
jgi:hypothetical protein